VTIAFEHAIMLLNYSIAIAIDCQTMGLRYNRPDRNAMC